MLFLLTNSLFSYFLVVDNMSVVRRVPLSRCPAHKAQRRLITGP